MSLLRSSGWPTLSCAARRATSATNSFATEASTSSRGWETQHSPLLKFMPKTTPAAASSRSASANTRLAALPPSSSEIFFMFPAAAASTFLPVAVEPVNDTRSTIFDSVSACPAGPAPETMFTTPSGTPASATSFMISHALELVNSLGLTTTVQPAASANGSFWHRISAGKFHGMIRPTTPTGSRSTRPVKSLSVVGERLALHVQRERGGVPAQRRGAADVTLGEDDRLAALLAVQPRELVGIPVDQVGQPVQDDGPLHAAGVRPGAGVERGARHRDGVLDGLDAGGDHLADHLVGAGRPAVDEFGPRGFDVVAVDEVANDAGGCCHDRSLLLPRVLCGTTLGCRRG